MKSGTWRKVPKLHSTLFLPQGVEIKLIFALLAAIFKIRAYFQNFHIWAWNLEFEDRSQSCIYTLLKPQGVEIKPIFALRTPVFEIRANLQSFHIWALNLEFEERSQSCICTLFLSQGAQNELIFALRAIIIKIWQFFTLIRLIRYVN